MAPTENPVRAIAAKPRSALGVLRSLASLLQTGLLTLDRTRVASEEACLLQRVPVGLAVNLVQCPGDAEAQRAGLAGVATTVNTRDLHSQAQQHQEDQIDDNK